MSSTKYSVFRDHADWPSDCIAVWVRADGTAYPMTDKLQPFEPMKFEDAIQHAEEWFSSLPKAYQHIIIHLDDGAQIPD